RAAIVESETDVAHPPEREHRTVENVGGRLRRVLLRPWPAAEHRPYAALCGIDGERVERAARCLRVAVLAGLQKHPHEQARSLALRDRRDPRRIEGERVPQRLPVHEAARLRAFATLDRDELVGVPAGGGEPLLAVAR